MKFQGSTSFQSMYEVTKYFRVRLGVYQGSVIKPYLLSVVMDEVAKEILG